MTDAKVAPAKQTLALASWVLGTLALVLGGGVTAAGENAARLGSLIVAGGVLLWIPALAIGDTIDVLPMLRRSTRKRGHQGELANWQSLKVVSILLNLLALAGGIVLAIAVLQRAGLTESSQGFGATFVMIGILEATLGVAMAAAYWQSLRTKLQQDRSSLKQSFHGLTMAGLTITALGGLFVAAWPDEAVALGASEIDSAMIAVAALLFATFNIFVSRSLPTMYVLLSEERRSYQGYVYFSRAKSVVAPTLIAFALLFVVLLLFLVFGAGVFTDLRNATLRPAFVILVFVILAALVASTAAAVFLGRKEDKLEVYKQKKPQEDITGQYVLYGSVALATLFAVLAVVIARSDGFLGLAQARWLDATSFALLIGLGPFGFYAAQKHASIRRLEERFPDFLRDLASSHKGGLTMPAAVTIAARGQYGPLQPEIKKMADQLSWNITFNEAMQRFADRLKTPLIVRTVALIQEASRSGGSTAEVLYAAARDAREIKNLENDRHLSMLLYTIIIYITFGVFLFVASVLFHEFIPQLIAASEAIAASPAAGTSTLRFSTVSIEAYRAFYFFAGIVQAIGGGIVAGYMGSGKGVLGLRHAFIMVSVTYLTFLLLL